ncbi:hypothetical protein VTN00DRAFT_4068 [Thermoascus crustaceus]|uniref:uncharacterized protein n=1 Tax=Thermoascus crustaceus TaxID=5088 RepID=UPI003743C79C
MPSPTSLFSLNLVKSSSIFPLLDANDRVGSGRGQLPQLEQDQEDDIVQIREQQVAFGVKERDAVLRRLDGDVGRRIFVSLGRDEPAVDRQ